MPAPRNERAASSRMLLAMISVPKTRSVDDEVRQDLAEHDPRGTHALGDGRVDELLLAQRQHLTADRAAEVRHVDHADDEDRDPERVALDGDGPDVQPAERERRAQRDREQEHRERPEDVEAVGDRSVGPAPGVTGEQPQRGRQDGRDEGGHEADEQRVAAAVEKPDHHVAAERVGPEEILLAEAWSDRRAVRGDDELLLAVDHDGAGGVRRRRAASGDVLGVQRRRRTAPHQEEEDHERGHRDPVALETPPGELPRPHPRKPLPALLLGDRGRRIEAEFAVGCRLRCQAGRSLKRGGRLGAPLD